ncbi:MAG: ABC transporter ATP-binding protein [Candidatus Bathyarchaeia archaeon]
MKIKTVNLTKVYTVGNSKVVAVNNVNLEIGEHKFIAVTGPSGSGKTTLLNLIGLNDKPTCGKIFIDGEDTSNWTNAKRRRVRLLRMGFVFQTFNLLPTLTALENVELPMALAGKSQKEQREKATKLLKNLGLGNRIHHRPKELSMGEMQRVAIARAMVNNPEVIIADEPTGELDSKTAKEIINLLLNVKEEWKTTVIVATHDEKIVEAADEIYALKDGQLTINSTIQGFR